MRLIICTFLLAWSICFTASRAVAQPQPGQSAKQPSLPAATPAAVPHIVPPEMDLTRIEHVFVPQSRLGSVFKNDRFSAVMPLSEFNVLVEKARARKSLAPYSQLPPVCRVANFQARVEGDQLLATMETQIDAAQAGAELDLNVTGWNVLSARSGDQNAAVARLVSDANLLRLFIPEAGTQTLKFELSAPLKNVGNDHLAVVGVPTCLSGEFHLSVRAGQFLRVNDLRLKRPAADDQPADYSFPVGGVKELRLIVSDRQQSSQLDVLTFASTAFGVLVRPSEMTWTAQTELQVFGQPIDRLVCRVPQSLEITKVESEGLESWELADEAEHAGRVTIRLKYRQPFEGNRTIVFQGILSDPPDQAWLVPNLEIAQVTSHTGFILITHPANVRLQALDSQGVRAVANPPPAANDAERGGERLCFEVWKEDFMLKFVTSLKQQQVQAAMTSLLFVSNPGLDLSVTLSLQTRQVPLFDARLLLPAEYRVLEVQRDGAAAKWDTLPRDAGVNEVRIALNPPLSPGQSTTVVLQSQAVPENWPVKETSVAVALPAIGLPQADMVEVMYGITAPEDLDLVPQEINGLDPATQSDMQTLNGKLSQAGQQMRIGFTSQGTDFTGQLLISRKPTLFTAQTLTFFRVSRETVFSRLEGKLNLVGGGFRELTVQLSESTGDQIQFRLGALPGTINPAQIVEQQPGEVAGEVRSWKLTFDRYLQGNYLLATEVEQPRGTATSFSPPHLVFPQSNAESGFLAVEGPSDELVKIDARSGDGRPLPSIDPVDLPASQYRPQERIVAGFQFVRPDWTASVTTTQFQRTALPSAVGHRLDLTSIWSPGSPFQHQAHYSFTAVGMQSLMVQLPTGATLWSTMLDGTAIEARHVGQGIQIPLSRLAPQQTHTLDIVYETPGTPARPQGEFHAQPPVIAVISGNGETQPLDILEQHWDLHYPQETILLGSDGAFEATQTRWDQTLLDRYHLPSRDRMLRAGGLLLLIAVGVLGLLAIIELARAGSNGVIGVLAILTLGGVLLAWLLLPAVQNARNTVAKSHRPEMTITPREEQGNFSLSGNDKSFGVNGDAAKGLDAPRSERRSGDQSMAASDAPAAAAASPVSKPMEQPPGQAGNPISAAPAAPQLPQAGSKSELTENLWVDQERNLTSPAKNPYSTGGLLSMTFALEIPQDSQTTTFQYQGNSTDANHADLRVQFASRNTAWLMILSIALGATLLGWWLRHGPTLLKATYCLLVILTPVILLGFVPVLWSPALLGLILGGLFALISWAITCCPCWTACRPGALRRFFRRSSAAGVLLMMAALTSSVRGEEARAVVPPTEAAPVPFVVIPYGSLQEIPDADRVYVPADLFRQLWEAAHPEDLRPVTASLPFAIAEGSADAKFIKQGNDQRIQLQLRWVITSFTDQPQTIPLPILTPGIQNPQLDGAPAILTPLPESKVGVIVSSRGTHVVDATVPLPEKVAVSQGHFRFKSLPVGSGAMTVEIPSKVETLSLRVNNINGIYDKTVENDVTRFQIPIDRGGEYIVRWQEVPTLNAADNNLQLETNVFAIVEDAGMRVLHDLELKIRKGSIGDFTFEIPADLALREVRGADISGWEVSEENGTRRLKIVFSRNVTNQTHFQVELYQSHHLAQMTETLNVTTLAPVGEIREAGALAIALPDHLRMRVVESQELQQIDVRQFKTTSNLPAPLSIPQAAFRFISRPFKLRVEISRRDAEARGTVEHGVQIGRRKTVLASRIMMNLTGAPRRLIEIQLPPGYITMDVVCANAADWYVLPAEQHQRLLIELERPQTGMVEIGLEGHIPKNPQDQNLTIQVPVPEATIRSSTSLGIWCDETYQATLAQSGNWRSIPSPDLPAPVRKLRSQPPQFAFQTMETPESLQIQLRQAIPEITGDAGTLIAVGDATVDYGLTMRWKISNGAADQFALTVPSWLGHLEFSGPGIRETRSEPAENGRTRWIISLFDPVRTQFLASAAATIASPADLIIPTPRLEFEKKNDGGGYSSLAVQRQFAVLVNLSQSQLAPADLGQFETVAVDQLPLAMPPALVQQAMEIVRVRPEKTPSWKMQRMEQVLNSQAVIPTCTLQTVLQMDGSWRTQAIFGVRNRGQQFLALKLPAESKILSVFVRGVASRTVSTKLGEQTIYLVALPQTSAVDLSFEVSLLLSGRLAHALPHRFDLISRQIQLPAVEVVTPQESSEYGISVAQTVWNVFVPDQIDAAPVEKSGSTNLTFHHEAGWIAVQMQTIDRMRGDIAEMKRIAGGSGGTTASQQEIAASNLKQLQQQLQNQEALSRDSSLAEDRIAVQHYLKENKRAIQETEDALSELQQAKSKGTEVQQALPNAQSEFSGVGNRGYINMNNAGLSAANGLMLDDESSIRGESETLNFFDTKGTRRNAVSGKKSAEEQESRVQLRQQLQSQSLGQGQRLGVQTENGQTQPHAREPVLQGNTRYVPPQGSLHGNPMGFRFNNAQGGMGGMGSGQSPLGAPVDNFAFPAFGAYDSQGSQPVLGRTLPAVKQQISDGGQDRGLERSKADSDFDVTDASQSMDGIALNQPGGSPVAAERVTTTQGLSVPMQLPQSGHELSFDKPGGSPALTLRVRSRTVRSLFLGAIWGIVMLWIGLMLLRAFMIRRGQDQQRMWPCFWLMLAGAAIFVLSSGVISVIGLILFCVTGFVLLARQVSIPAAA